MIKKAFLVLLGLIILCLAFGYFYIQSLKPTYNGELSLEGLSGKVEVYFDSYGIPHIYAETEADGYLALGYVHAQDRLFQMEVFRRIAAGRLSEIFGSKMLEADKFFRTIGIHKYSEIMVSDFAKNGNQDSRKAAEAYLSGVNQFIEQGPTPIEFTILGIDKTPFQMVDCFNAIGYMGFSFAAAQRIEPLLTKIYMDLGPEYLAALDLGSSQYSLDIKNYENIDANTELSNFVTKVMDGLPAPLWYGSNSWVLGPEKTKSGKVLFENDPHIKFSQPAIWYEAHMESPEFSTYGYHIAGVPFAVLSHNRKYAVGMTMFTNDDIDFFQEKPSSTDPNLYEYKGQNLEYKSRKEKIVVKDSTDVEIEVRESVHGPIINDIIDLEGDPVSMYWTYTKTEEQIPSLLYDLGHAEDLEEVKQVSSKLHAPGLNIMYGDAEGNIAWIASAKLLERADSAHAVLINDGSSGGFDPVGFYPFSENPKAINPPWNYVYSANNQTRMTSGKLVPGHYAAEDRGRRIVTIIEGKEKFDMNDMMEMTVDDTSENIPEVLASIIDAINTENLSEQAKQAIKFLSKWEANHKSEAVGPTIYTKLQYKILNLCMVDELGKEDFEKLFTTHMIQRSMQPLFSNDSTVWWDNIATDEVERRSDIFARALEQSVKELTNQLGPDMQSWTWNRVHTIEHEHPFGTIEALRSTFNVGAFEVEGSGMVINNLKFPLNETGEYGVTAGPSTRRLVDFADVEKNSWSILPTGNSGNPFSKHYDDQAEMFAKGEFRKQMMNKEEIVSTSPDILTLYPE